MVTVLLALAAALPIGGFLRAHEESQGYGGFTGAGYFDLYARVAPFADCAKFSPPAGTARPVHPRAALAATGPRLLGVQRQLAGRASVRRARRGRPQAG